MRNGLGNPKLPDDQFVNFEVPNSGAADDQTAYSECADCQCSQCQRARGYYSDRVRPGGDGTPGARASSASDL
jgi:hypothetical protein